MDPRSMRPTRSTSPAKSGWPSPKSKQTEMKFWTPPDLRTFLASVEADRLYAAWVLTATTGMRRGELAGLRWVDVDFPAGRVHVRKPRVMADGDVVISEPKTKRGRRGIALDHRTLGALSAWQERQSQERELVGHGYIDSGMVFTQPDGAASKPYLFTDWWLRFGDLLRDPVVYGDMTGGLLVTAAYVAVFGALAWARLGTKDVSS